MSRIRFSAPHAMSEGAASGGVAALAMYDWPELAAANDAIWDYMRLQLAAKGIAAPRKLKRALRHYQPWLDPNLLLAQTCGYPLVTELRGKVQLLGTPVYDVPDCAGSDYCSVIIARRASGIMSLDAVSDATAAINAENSQSGHWALKAALAGMLGAQPPKRAVLTGGHRESLLMLAGGKADLAAIDAVCWALALRHEPAAAATVRIIAYSPMAPGLPLITSLATSAATVAALRAAFHAVIADPALAKQRAALFLAGFDERPEADYQRILDLKNTASKIPLNFVPG